MSSLEIPSFLVLLRKKESREKINVGICITQTWSVHSSKLTGSIMITAQVWIFIFSFVRMNQCSSFCLCVLCNLKNEFFYWLDFIFLFRGLFEGPQSLDVRRKFSCGFKDIYISWKLQANTYGRAVQCSPVVQIVKVVFCVFQFVQVISLWIYAIGTIIIVLACP